VPYNDLFYSDTSGCDPDDGITFKFDRERPPPDANGILNFASWSAREFETEFNTDDDWDGRAHDANESVNGENPFFTAFQRPSHHQERHRRAEELSSQGSSSAADSAAITTPRRNRKQQLHTKVMRRIALIDAESRLR
jgi:hypothetical protein